MNTNITINSRKFDGSIHRTWQCEMVNETPEFYLFLGSFETEIIHSKLGIIRPKTISYEYYFKEKWFNIFRFHEPEGELKYYYCNINMPPILQNSVLDYIDLDIDILVKPDMTFEVLDEDEFTENSLKYGYDPKTIGKVKNSIQNIFSLIKARHFPFDFA